MRLDVRQVRRIQRNLETGAGAAIVRRLCGRPFHHRIAPARRKRVLDAYREDMMGFGPTFAAEKLRERGIEVKPSTLRNWLVEEGLWTPRRPQERHRRRRERPECFGERVQANAVLEKAFLPGSTARAPSSPPEPTTPTVRSILPRIWRPSAAFKRSATSPTTTRSVCATRSTSYPRRPCRACEAQRSWPSNASTAASTCASRAAAWTTSRWTSPKRRGRRPRTPGVCRLRRPHQSPPKTKARPKPRPSLLLCVRPPGARVALPRSPVLPKAHTPQPFASPRVHRRTTPGGRPDITIRA